MAKIEVLEPIDNRAGVFYYAGFVNGIFTKFLGYTKLTTKEIKNKLFRLYMEDIETLEIEREM